MTVHAHPHDAVVAEVDGVAIGLDAVEDVLARMRRGPAAPLLPRDDGAEGRQLRRWLVQLLTVERLVEHTAAERGVTPADRHRAPWRPDPTAALELGSVPVAVLVASPLARAVYEVVTAGVDAPAGHRRQEDTEPERRLVRLVPADGGAPQHLGWVRVDQYAGPLGAAIAATEPGRSSGPVGFAGAAWTVHVDEVRPGGVRTADVADLRDAARRHAFVDWIERQRRARVTLRPGFEHPADPHQPDNTHRH
ncbi:DUF7158 domain-containing protein [Actinocatenispora rupis]|uniref:Malonyl CoA-ACP transacylase n=1 Tax=Actinocatenispora rupis TaxID=519421 RepID=A0A8J3IVT3_9ACTN|nr:peptidylprolyl isomerase [Actinocatenispora rupis]GID10871.1 malonyl CoA-ACP transacylase [Actinocatenispora rupis]